MHFSKGDTNMKKTSGGNVPWQRRRRELAHGRRQCLEGNSVHKRRNGIKAGKHSWVGLGLQVNQRQDDTQIGLVSGGNVEVHRGPGVSFR